MKIDRLRTRPNIRFHSPTDFRVIAIISTYNEEDVIVPVIQHLINQGIDVYVIDNWSTDSTYELVKEFESGVIGHEIWPADGRPETYDWGDILRRKEELSRELEADWFIHNDADEIRESPWPWVRLKDAVFIADQAGFNAIDFATLEFAPVDNFYKAGTDLGYFKYFFIERPSCEYFRTNAWKKLAAPVNLTDTGGHTANFTGRKVFTCQFILKHYPIRSQEHGERKIHRERKPRYNPTEREKGWHVQYDWIEPGKNFLSDPNELTRFTENFYNEFIIQQMVWCSKHVQTLDESLEKFQNPIYGINDWINRIITRVKNKLKFSKVA